jgi:hypothetical protein
MKNSSESEEEQDTHADHIKCPSVQPGMLLYADLQKKNHTLLRWRVKVF